MSTLTGNALMQEPSIVRAFNNRRPWEFGDQCQRRIHHVLGEMIALDNQPFNVVNSRGFWRVVAVLEPHYTLLSDKYFRMLLIPELFKMMSAKMIDVLASARFVSSTTDSRTTSQCTDSFRSITAHWITDSWDRQSAVVAAGPIARSHTAQNLAGIVASLLEKWNVGTKVHIFLRDNAKNMAAGLREAGVQSDSCFSHTLQLCVKTSLAS